jgi:pimeloyl-CoA dehydrogenase
VTGKRQDGISFLLVDLASPGITRRPIRSLTGYPTFADEFFDDVRIPAANRIGEEGKGWRVAKALLDAERSNIVRAAQMQRFLDELVDWCHGQDVNPLADPVQRSRLARLFERIEVGRALSYRIAHLQATGNIDSTLASLSKLYLSELTVEVHSAGMQLLGLRSTLGPNDQHAVLAGYFSDGMLLSLLHRIGGGTSEIQRDVIASHGLGLPR